MDESSCDGNLLWGDNKEDCDWGLAKIDVNARYRVGTERGYENCYMTYGADCGDECEYVSNWPEHHRGHALT